MPGLSQLKKFDADILSLGNEPALRASRGEKPVAVPIPKDVKEFNDSDDFLMGMPEPVESAETESKNENVAEDFSDIMGTESSLQNEKNEEEPSAPKINLSVPDISSIVSGGDGGSEPDLSMFEEPVQNSAQAEQKEPEPEKEPEIADLSLEDLLGGQGFDGTLGKDDFQDSEKTAENGDDGLETLQDAENIPEAEPLADLEPQNEAGNLNPAEDFDVEPVVPEMDSEPVNAESENTEHEPENTEHGPDVSSGIEDILEPENIAPEPEKNAGTSENEHNEIDSAEPGVSDGAAHPEDEPIEENFKDSDFQDIAGLDIDSPDFFAEPDVSASDDALKTDAAEKTSESENPSEPEKTVEPEPSSETEKNAEPPENKNLEPENPSASGEFDDFSLPDEDFSFGDENDEKSDSSEKVSDAEKLADDFDSDFAFDGNSIDMGEGIPDAVPEKNSSAETDDFPSDFNFDLNDTDSDSENSGDGFQEKAPTEKFDTSEMEGLDFGIPDTDSALEKGNFELGNSNDFSVENNDFEIPGFSDVQTVEVNKNGKFKVSNAEKTDSQQKDSDGDLPPNTLSDEQYKKFIKNLSSYPLNVRMAVEELIVKNEFTDEAEFEIIQKVLKKISARQLASELEKMLDIAIPVPRDFERRTAEEYEAYKASFQYQLSNKIIPGAIISFAALIVCFFMFQFARFFIYQPARASSLYRQGYKLLESENFPQSETKFSEATKYQLIKKWFFRYAHGYREHKQFIRAEQMYKNILYCFKFDKTAGLEYAEMEYKDLANYEKAEKILLRDVLDHHINDADGILMLGDNYLEWADEKDSSKYGEALKRYAELVQLYGPTDKYMSRMMRYYIRTDSLKEVLPLKEHFFPRPKSLEGQDWTELSGYCLDKLYGPLAPSDEYLRAKIEDVKKLLVRAVQTDGENPSAYYNLGRYYINTNDSANAEKALQQSISFFNKTNVAKKKDYYKNIDSYRLLGEIYTGEKEYLKAMESFADGITLFSNANVSSGLEGNSKIGNLYSDMGDIEYFISGNYENALQNYKDAVSNDYDNGKIRYKIGFIQYSKKNYPEAVGSFMKSAEDFSDDQNLLLAMGNTLSLRNDNFAAEGYYERLLDQIDNYRGQHGILFPQSRKDDNEIVETYLKASNNLGVTLYKLAKRTGSSAMNAKSMVKFQDSMRAWDSLTRNQKTMVRLGGSNLAEQNLKYVTNPMPDYEPAIYTELPRTLTVEKGLSQ